MSHLRDDLRTEAILNYINEELAASGQMRPIQSNPTRSKHVLLTAGHLIAYGPQASYSGRELGPAFLLIMRLNPRAGWRLAGALVVDGTSLEIHCVQTDSSGNDFHLSYFVQGDPPSESFRAGDVRFPPQSGRVFLVDLTADPPTVSQLKHDLATLFRPADRTPAFRIARR